MISKLVMDTLLYLSAIEARQGFTFVWCNLRKSRFRCRAAKVLEWSFPILLFFIIPWKLFVRAHGRTAAQGMQSGVRCLVSRVLAWICSFWPSSCRSRWGGSAPSGKFQQLLHRDTDSATSGQQLVHLASGSKPGIKLFWAFRKIPAAG